MTEDDRLYLQFLQNNIARMNTNSAQAKGWCIAIVAALLAIFVETKNSLLIWICIIPILLFCILDTLYLQQEHKFIGMYNDFVKGENSRPKVYEMPMKSYERGMKGFLKALQSWSVLVIYGLMAVTGAVILVGSRSAIETDGSEVEISETTTIQNSVESKSSVDIKNAVQDDFEVIENEAVVEPIDYDIKD